jgi:hypothetical protein
MEARSHFGHAPRALGDDHEIHDHQDGEDDDADDEVAAHDETVERFDDMTGRVGALVSARQDQVAIKSTVGNAENSRRLG